MNDLARLLLVKGQMLRIVNCKYLASSTTPGDGNDNSEKLEDKVESSSAAANEEADKTNLESIDDLAAPTTCCMSGCVNCVWVQYAEKLQKILKTSDDEVRKIIMEKVEDPNMRAFLMMELRCRKFNE